MIHELIPHLENRKYKRVKKSLKKCKVKVERSKRKPQEGR